MRRRYIYDEAHDTMVEVTEVPARHLAPDAGALWGDASYRNLQAPDGTPIDTRTKHRAYMKERGVTTIDDYNSEFKKRAEQRAKLFQGAPDPQRPWDIARAWDQVRDRRG